MAFYEDLVPLISLSCFRDRAHNLSEALIRQVLKSVANTECSAGVETGECRDDAVALRLKLAAIVAILIAGVAGVAIPLVGKKRRFLRTDSSVFVLTKAFAAGVILATGFVHMLSDGETALTDPCLPRWPWSEFPFSGFVAMVAALGTLVLDFLGTQFYERKHQMEEKDGKVAAAAASEEEEEDRGVGIVDVADDEEAAGGKDKDPMHIVGMHAHAAAHRHSHPHRRGACEGHDRHGHAHVDEENGHSSRARHVVVSQILELGIVSHSVIIGLSLGVSQSPCTIRPLIGALAFHQFFEGFALGGCISQAQFRTMSATLMACFFAITTPSGIGVGAALASFYNPNSPRALVVEGVLDSVSAGILIYMALVDLIAADFLSRSMSCNVRLQVASYIALFLGAGSMSLLAVWA